ncbi:MAG: hypothetical protein U0R80_14235 [Nocardioidaceae bacterium]
MDRTPPAPAVDALAVTVHGPVGALDLLVPAASTVREVAAAYARQTGLGAIPVLLTTVGTPLRPDRPLVDLGVGPGSVVVAVAGVDRRAGAPPEAPAPLLPRSGQASRVWLAVAAALALVAGWSTTRLAPGSGARDAVLAVLLVAAFVGVVPVGRLAGERAVAAPSFAAAAALGLAWTPEPEALPVVVGIAALAGAVTAAVARALSAGRDEGLLVWMVAGGAFFGLAALTTLAGLGPQVVWSLALVGGMLAARLVPAAAIDVPDQLLVDLERLAVTAWSARDRPRGRRGRTLVSPAQVAAVAERGGRIVTAGSAAIAGVVVLSSVELLVLVRTDIDRQGARWLVLLAAGALLLAARSYRHRAARAWLRTGALLSWAALAWLTLAGLDGRRSWLLVGACLVVAGGLVVAAVAAGRGWRSAWWSRRAEVAEALAGALAVAAVSVSSGLFRHLWEIGSTMFRG